MATGIQRTCPPGAGQRTRIPARKRAPDGTAGRSGRLGSPPRATGPAWTPRDPSTRGRRTWRPGAEAVESGSAPFAARVAAACEFGAERNRELVLPVQVPRHHREPDGERRPGMRSRISVGRLLSPGTLALAAIVLAGCGTAVGGG